LNRPEPISAPAAGQAHDGLDNPQRLLAFSTLAMALTMAVLDGNIVTIALPTMARQFAVAPESAIWIVNAFQLAVTVAQLPLAALGDILGYRRVYWWGLAVFTAASLACALAPTFAVLTFARLIQGFGAAGLMSVNIALIRFIYPHSRLGQGVGNMAVVVAVASAASPSVAAAILSVASWHWLFLVNVPIGALALAMAARTLPATPRAAGRLDLISVILNALAFVAGVNRIGQGGAQTLALVEIGLGAAIGVVLVKRQLKLPAPLLPVDLLRRPVFALSLATSITAFGAQSLAMVALPFYFEDALGRSAAATGLLLTPWPVGTALIRRSPAASPIVSSPASSAASGYW
jgi:MFS transporter, DHA2 family, multidrug resistance protein